MDGLRLSVESGVATLTLDRPKARNALTPELIAELARAIEEVGADRAVVLRGGGSSFCAGYNLNRLTSPGTDEAGSASRPRMPASRCRRHGSGSSTAPKEWAG